MREGATRRTEAVGRVGGGHPGCWGAAGPEAEAKPEPRDYLMSGLALEAPPRVRDRLLVDTMMEIMGFAECMAARPLIPPRVFRSLPCGLVGNPIVVPSRWRRTWRPTNPPRGRRCPRLGLGVDFGFGFSVAELRLPTD